MMRTFTGCKGYCAAVLSTALLCLAPATSWADGGDAGQADEAAPIAAGAWTVESGQPGEPTPDNPTALELADARLTLAGGDGWTLVADRVVLAFDGPGRLDSLTAHGNVRLVGRVTDTAGAGHVYAVGQHAWFDSMGVRGLVLGADVAVLRRGWRMRAAYMDIELTAARLALRGVESGPVRARRDDNK